MATDIGDLRLTASADTSDLEQKLARSAEALDEVGSHAKGMGADTQAAFKDFQTNTQVALDNAQKQIDELKKAIQGLSNETENLPSSTDPATQSMDGFKDTMGDADSSLQGLAGAVDHVSPGMANLKRVTGDFAGGAEAAVNGGNLLAKSLGALTSPMGLVALTAATVGATLLAMSRDAGKAAINTEHLDEALNALQDTSNRVSATALELRVESGELSSLEAQLENVASTVRKDMAPSLEAARAPFALFFEAVETAEKNVFKLEEGLFAATSGAIPATGREIQNARATLVEYKEELRAADDALKVVTSGMGDAAIALRGVQDNIEREIELRTELITLRIAEAEEREQEKRDREAEAARQERRRKRLERERKEQEALRKLEQQRAEALRLLGGEAEASLNQELKALNELKDAAVITAEAFDFLAEEAAARADAAALAEIQARKDALGEILDVTRDANADIISAREQLDQDAQERVEAQYKRNHDLTQSIKDAEERALAFTKHRLDQGEISEREAADQVAKIKQDALLESMHLELAHEQALTALHDEESRKRIEITQAERDAQIAQLQEVANRANEFATLGTNLLNSLSDLAFSNLNAQREAYIAQAGEDAEERERLEKEFNEMHRGEMLKAFSRQQAANVLTATMNGALAITKALAELGPVAGAIAVPLIAGATAAQIAVIQNQKPSFHQGGIVSGDGDQQITAQGGEAVLNRNAVANIGEDGVNSLNAGGGMPQSLTVNLMYRQQVFNQMIIDNIRTGGALAINLKEVQMKASLGLIGGLL